MVTVLALDQALRMSGYAVFEDNKPTKWGTVEPVPKSANVPLALRSIRRQFREIIKSVHPDTIIMEVPMGGDENPVDNHQTAFTLAQVYGVLSELCAEENIIAEPMYASTWQKVCGIHKRDRASRKAGAVEFVKKKYGITAPQDAVDALCIGYTYIEQNKPERSAF